MPRSDHKTLVKRLLLTAALPLAIMAGGPIAPDAAEIVIGAAGADGIPGTNGATPISPALATQTLIPEQMEHVVALDRLQKSPDATYRLAGVAYAVHYADALTNEPNEKIVMALAQTPNAFYDQGADVIFGTKVLSDVASRKAAQLDGTDLSCVSAETPPNIMADSVTSIETSNPEPTTIIRLLYPPEKPKIENVVSKNALILDLNRDFAIAWVAWAYDQARLGTPVGKVLIPYINKYNTISNDLAGEPSVTAAQDRVNQILTETKNKTPNADIVNKIISLKDVSNKVQRSVSNLKLEFNPVVSAPGNSGKDGDSGAPQSNSSDIQDLTQAQYSLEALSYVSAIAGNDTVAKVGATTARVVGGLATIEKYGATLGPAFVAAGYFGIAFAVMSAVEDSNNNTGAQLDAIMTMLTQISQQIENLREELIAAIGALDSKNDRVVDAVDLSITSDQL